MNNLETVGLSKKVLAAVAAACGAQLIALVVTVIASGEFDRTELAQVVGVALTAALGVIAGWLAPPNPLIAKEPSPPAPTGTTLAPK